MTVHPDVPSDPGRSAADRPGSPDPARGAGVIDLLGYAYPWDLEPGGGASPLVDWFGLHRVAVAAAYHSVRAATPRHQRRRFVEAPHSAVYFGLRPEVWRGRRLVPSPAEWMAADAFSTACRAVRAGGARPLAWVVLTHNSRLGAAHPDLTVRNAFGDRYRHALCPARPEVVEYAATLASEAVLAGPADGVVLEAAAALGVQHGAAHDKMGLAPSRTDQLSVCFCPACDTAYRTAGLEPDELAGSIARAVRDDVDAALEELWGTDAAAAVLDARQDAARRLIAAVVDAVRDVRPDAETVAHTSSRTADWSASGLTPAAADATDRTACWLRDGSTPGTAEETSTARAWIVEHTHAAWRDPATADRLVADVAASGVRELQLYHLGLLRRDTVDTVTHAIRAARRTGSVAPPPVVPTDDRAVPA
ncbi:hypothetical protein [Nakamurella endophytica]|uniref:Alanine-rich protein n=1 Tax=Nakamurella endophytica TaxID=1748367 RepID=A0A917SW08_9ACTN|nr:hypothetical protein [Nakamurella endophytica]GGL98697.1 hypothetical protein GCM10011594_18220 [Nakamurella endophytica]